jgi:predicted nuclease of predicted toxin-antitoxin system
MKFLLDQDVYFATASFLKELGHDVVTASEIGCSQASDLELLELSQKENRIFITRDRDFGGLVFVKHLSSSIIYLRTLPSTLNSVHNELERILSSYTEDEFKKVFITVEPGRYRVRKIS